MRLFRIGFLLGLIICLLFSVLPVFADDNGDSQNFASDRILIKFKPGIDKNLIAGIHGRYGGAVIEEIPQLGVQVVRVPSEKLLEKINSYKGERFIEFVEPDYIMHAFAIPNDPYFSNQWGMTKIQAPQAWDITSGQSDIKIAILDSGIDQNHEDLAGKIVANKNYTYSSTVDDRYGHGTHVAGIAAAATNNSIGVAGVGYNCKIMNVKVLGDSGSGYTSWISSGITWAADNGAKVISMSFGASTTTSTLESAVNYAWNKGVVVVAAAGNNNSSVAVYPAYYDKCVAVAATDSNDARASFSSYGNWVDVAAPGVDIYSTMPNHSNRLGTTNYGSLSGTSMATPFVAGLAGLVWSTAYGTGNTSVRDRIEDTADSIAGTGTYWLNGRINAYKAVASSVEPQPPSLSISISVPSQTNQASFTVNATVSNSGDSTVNGVTATLVLPVGLSSTGYTKSLGDIAGKSSASTSWTVTASADGQYTITVNAADVSNAYTASGTASIKVDTSPPTQVSGLTVTTAGSSQLNLSWTQNSETDLKNYKVFRSTIPGGPYSLIASPFVNSYPDTGLNAATTYYYVVCAVDTSGNEGATSNEASGTTNPASAKTMHVKSITMSLQSFFNYRRAGATVTVVDAANAAINGAAVSGHWSGATTNTVSGTTNSSGQVTLYSSYKYPAPSGTTFTFTVDNVVLSGWTYDPAANIETSDSIKVP